MPHPSRLVGLLILSSSFLYAAPATSPQGLPAERLHARLANLVTLESAFRQVTLDATNRTIQQNDGHLWISAPSRFRVESREPFAQTLVSDGENFWTYDEDLAQVIVRRLEADVHEVPILLLSGNSANVTENYHVSYYEDGEAEHYVLAPKSRSSLFESLSIEFSNESPRAITLADSLGQRTRIELGDVSENQPIEEERFTFATPAGVDLIDDRVTE